MLGPTARNSEGLGGRWLRINCVSIVFNCADIMSILLASSRIKGWFSEINPIPYFRMKMVSINWVSILLISVENIFDRTRLLSEIRMSLSNMYAWGQWFKFIFPATPIANFGLKAVSINWKVGWKNSLSQKLRKIFLKFTIAVLSIYFIDFYEICRIVCEWHWQSILPNFMKIDEIDAEHCDGKL